MFLFFPLKFLRLSVPDVVPVRVVQPTVEAGEPLLACKDPGGPRYRYG